MPAMSRLYWYGWNNGVEKCISANGWSTFVDSCEFKSGYIKLASPGSSRGGIGTKEKVNGTVRILYKGTSTYVHCGSICKTTSKNFDSTFTELQSTDTTLKYYQVNISNGYAMMSVFNGQGGNMYAVLVG